MIDLKMPDINTVIVAGNLTCNPSFRKTTNGTPVANFYIASNRKFKDNTGQWRENVCYVGVVAWYKLAESCYENLKRGSAVIVDGELQSRSWRNTDGTSRNVVEIKARRIQFLNRKPPQEISDYANNAEFSEVSEDHPNNLYTDENDGYFSDENVTSEGKTSDSEKPQPPSSPEDTGDDFSFGYEKLQF